MLGAHQLLSLSHGLCVGCGICANTCPHESIKLSPATIKNGRLAKKALVDFDTRKCTFCGICAVLCPTNAIQTEINGKQTIPVVEAKIFPSLMKRVEVDVKKCNVACDLVCQDTCPTKAVEIVLKKADNGKIRGVQNVTVDTRLCVFCKRCESVCPEKAFRVIKPVYGGLELDTASCPDGCQACIDICPSKAISLGEGKKPRVEDEFCIYCGACKEVCPAKAISFARTQILHTDASSGAWITALEKLTSRPCLVKELTSKNRKKLREATQNIRRL